MLAATATIASVSEARQDYQRDLLVIGLVELGATVYTTFDAAHLFRSFPPERCDDAVRFGYYHGRGFTYGRSLDDALRDRARRRPPRTAAVRLLQDHREQPRLARRRSRARAAARPRRRQRHPGRRRVAPAEVVVAALVREPEGEARVVPLKVG